MRPSGSMAGSVSRPMFVAIGCRPLPSAFITQSAVRRIAVVFVADAVAAAGEDDPPVGQLGGLDVVIGSAVSCRSPVPSTLICQTCHQGFAFSRC